MLARTTSSRAFHCAPVRRTATILPARSSRTQQRVHHVCHAIKLYTNPGSRGKITEWYLAELNIPFETVNLDMRRGEHKTPAFLAINPFGQVPALEDGDLKLFESGGILLHLANKYGQLEADQLGEAAQWTLFANSTLSEALFTKGPGKAGAVLSVLESVLAKKPYLAGDKFTVSDIAVGSYLLYIPIFFPDMDLTKYPNMWKYMKNIVGRPTCPQPYKEAMAAAKEAEQPQAGGLGGLFKKMGL